MLAAHREGATTMAWMNYLVTYLASREDEEGQGMVEYGLIIALVAIVAAVSLALLGPAIAAVFDDITGQI
jgi:pilus assembly protein Flp/PilA